MYTLDDIYDVFKQYPRSEWKDKISNMILREDNEAHMSFVIESEGDEYDFPMDFSLSSLDKNFRSPLDIGTYVKDSKGNEFYVNDIPALDNRLSDVDPIYLVDIGDKTELVKKSNDTLEYSKVFIEPNSSEFTTVSANEVSENFKELVEKGLAGEFEIFESYRPKFELRKEING